MPTSLDTTLSVLQKGKLSLQGEFLWGSNYTYLVTAVDAEHVVQGVYKPTRGARPLWDFPPTSLARREVAAYFVSQALGWDLVPPTAYRRDGPLGPGSVQLFIEHEPEYHYYHFSHEDVQRLRPTVLFDLLTNNADRKGSHVLLDSERRMWLIDHGLCFHVDDKLRTVIWDFAGEPIPVQLLEQLKQFRAHLILPEESLPDGKFSELASTLHSYISVSEIKALRRRADRLVETGYFPNPDPNHRQVPWPPV